jgi:D-alanyl-D-alanine dipeptidase
MKLLALAILAILSAPGASLASNFSNLERELSRNSSLVDVSHWPELALDIRYSTPDNFMNRDIYGTFESCFLHVKAADQLKRSIAALKSVKPKWKFLIFDCLRPRRAQHQLWEMVKGTPQQKYVMDPAVGSVHNYGFAVDLSLADEAGHEVDMGTKYDFFGPLAEPKYEAEFLKKGKLSARQLSNRKILRDAMKTGGFIPISNEWWHFDGLPGPEVRAKYKIVE